MKPAYLFVLKCIAIWLILSALFFFSAEKITKWLVPGYHSVDLWITVVLVGLIFIFIVSLLVIIIGLRKRSKKARGGFKQD